MDIKRLRYNLIDAIMHTTDVSRLHHIYRFILGDKEIDKQVEKPSPAIPVVEIKYGVSLEEITASQQTSNITYAEITSMVDEEDWDQSLEELLDSLN